jgi:EAL domain-containing protein (putative c-di-GMP-specific phosphodiesterase class I)
MYAAKRSHRGHAFYDPTFDTLQRERLAMIADLQCAVERNEFVLDYQPIVSLRTGKIERMEALVRWRHPRRGLVPPGEFIGLAEETGLIGPLTLWVLEAALAQWRTWCETGRTIPIAVNVSPVALRDPEVGARMLQMVIADGTVGRALEVEITESAVMMDPEWATAALQPFRALGMRVAIDDFGVGYSSLARLKNLPVDDVKIDRGFVQNMTSDDKDRAIVRSVIVLAHQLGLTVVAEGCENQATRTMLEASGCDLVQGYDLSRPMSPAELAVWLNKHGDRVPWVGRTPVR